MMKRQRSLNEFLSKRPKEVNAGESSSLEQPINDESSNEHQTVLLRLFFFNRLQKIFQIFIKWSKAYSTLNLKKKSLTLLNTLSMIFLCNKISDIRHGTCKLIGHAFHE